MQCFIYRSSRKLDTYLYLAEEDDFDCLPETIIKIFGPPEFSMQIELTVDRKLAQEDSAAVLENLKQQGFHIQLPKTDYDIRQLEKQLIRELENQP